MTHNLVAVAGVTSLSVIAGSLTLDETWSPYAQGELTIVAPNDMSVIDPRTNARVTLTFTYTPLGTTIPAQTLTADLGIRSYQREQDGTVTLTLQSDEAFLQDLQIWASPLGAWQETNVRTFITKVFTVDLPNDQAAFSLSLEPGAATGTIDKQETFKQSQRYWDYLNGPLLPLSLRLWCDEQRRFWLTTIDAAVAGAVTLSDATTVVEASESVDRNGDLWADNIILQYWDDAAGNPTMIMGSLGPGQRSRTLLVKVEAKAPFDQFTNPNVAIIPAQAILARLQKRGRSIPIKAVSDYTVRPGKAATLNVFGTPQTGRVQAVRWNYPDDTMVVTTRDLTEI